MLTKFSTFRVICFHICPFRKIFWALLITTMFHYKTLFFIMQRILFKFVLTFLVTFTVAKKDHTFILALCCYWLTVQEWGIVFLKFWLEVTGLIFISISSFVYYVICGCAVPWTLSCMTFIKLVLVWVIIMLF